MAIMGFFSFGIYRKKNTFTNEVEMKELKSHPVSVKLNDAQVQLLEKLIQEGKAKTKASALQYLINQYSILNSK